MYFYKWWTTLLFLLSPLFFEINQMSFERDYKMTYLSLKWSSHSSSYKKAGHIDSTNNRQVFRICGALFRVGFYVATLLNCSLTFQSSQRTLIWSICCVIRLTNFLTWKERTTQTNSGLRLQSMSVWRSGSIETKRQTFQKQLNRTRIVRHWFVAMTEKTNISPTYRWNMLNDNRWQARLPHLQVSTI